MFLDEEIRFLELAADVSYEELLVSVGRVFVESYLIKARERHARERTALEHTTPAHTTPEHTTPERMTPGPWEALKRTLDNPCVLTLPWRPTA